jgi:phospholipid/cholesterol/gamma-HCH transport system substrate-binding protein
MKFTRELKFGIIVIGALFLVYFGLNFLKGVNIFSAKYSYYTQYEYIGGLVVSSPVYIRGYKVGQVDRITHDFSQPKPFTVRFSVLRDVRLPKGTIVEKHDDGLLGGRALQLLKPMPAEWTGDFYDENDVIASQIALGLMGELSGILLPMIEQFSNQTDSLLRSIRGIIESESLQNTLESVEKITANLISTTSQFDNMMSNQVPQILENADRMIANFTQVGESVDNIVDNIDVGEINKILSSLDHAIASAGTAAGGINDLSIGLLQVSSSADSLLIDLRQNPRRYVHFSLFGRRDR